jgi:release factor glutamine methyltransferase
LAVAYRNADRHNVIGRITFVQADVLKDLTEPADLIVSNPPYVPAGDAATLQAEVARYEPSSALYGGPDGLDVIRRLVGSARQHLAAGGWLIIEFGFGQEAAVREVAREAGWNVARIRSDLQGIPRVAVLRR